MLPPPPVAYRQPFSPIQTTPAVEGLCRNGVVLVGETFQPTPRPFQGRMGEAFTRMLLRRGHKRDSFGLVECPLPLDEGEGMRSAIRGFATRKVIVAMGHHTFSALTGVTGNLAKERGYVEWVGGLGAWVIGTFSPGWLIAGHYELSGVFLHDIERALDIATAGYIPHHQVVWEDPPLQVVEGWVDAYLRAHRADPLNTWLAYDIETPYKAVTDDEGELAVDDPSYTILRIGFSWREGDALSIPWQAHYLPAIQRLLVTGGVKIAHNGRYDLPRVKANGMTVNGPQWDTMWAWHLINSDLPMGLAFIAPMLAPGQARWKHLSGDRPAFYNGVDAEVTRRVMARLHGDLKAHHLWEVFQRHMVELDVILEGMTSKGLRIDQAAREEASVSLATTLTGFRQHMQEVVPLAAKRLKGYKKAPKGVEWSIGDPAPPGYVVKALPTVRKQCSICGTDSPTKPHFKTLKKPTAKRPQNPCAGGEVVEVEMLWPTLSRIELFVPSVHQLTTYASACGHRLQMTKVRGKASTVTFDDHALKALMKAYPTDRLYPLVRDYREVEKLLSTYVGVWNPDTLKWEGGPPTSAAGRVHSIFGHAPSTLRLSSRAPNLNNIPRDGEEADSPASLIKRLYVPDPGEAFAEFDFKAIEAQLVGYFANDATYVRAAKLGIHDFLNSHILTDMGLIAAPADMAWSDADLKACFKDLKRRFPHQRHVAKIVCHSSNYATTPRHLHDLHPEAFPKVADALRLQSLYFALFPSIRKWQEQTVKMADDSGYLKNPFGYIHRFWQVLTWQRNRGGEWESSWGDDAKRALAFVPQSTAAGLLKEAMLELWYNSPYGDCLRVPIHDSLLCAAPASRYDGMVETVMRVMERPSMALPLPWAEGHLMIEVEAKGGAVGTSWGDLQELKR
jgi:DNA polymerase I-like protein with 3'-5' exonuclease and polymerase domains